jgi:hypothetical protein
MLQQAILGDVAKPEARSAWRTWFAAIALIFLTEPVLGQIVAILGLLEPSPVLRYFWVPGYLLILRLVADEPRATLRAVAVTPLLVALALLAFCSTFWSIAPDTSLRRAFALTLTMVLGWRLAILPWRDLILT